MIKFMLEFGADVNIADLNGLTVVHYCALIGHWEHLELLIPLLSHNLISVSGDSVQSCADYYFRDCIPREVKNLVEQLKKKGTRHANQANYSWNSMKVITCYYRHNSDISRCSWGCLSHAWYLNF